LEKRGIWVGSFPKRGSWVGSFLKRGMLGGIFFKEENFGEVLFLKKGNYDRNFSLRKRGPPISLPLFKRGMKGDLRL